MTSYSKQGADRNGGGGCWGSQGQATPQRQAPEFVADSKAEPPEGVKCHPVQLRKPSRVTAWTAERRGERGSAQTCRKATAAARAKAERHGAGRWQQNLERVGDSSSMEITELGDGLDKVLKERQESGMTSRYLLLVGHAS